MRRKDPFQASKRMPISALPVAAEIKRRMGMFENYFTEEGWDAFFIKEEGGGKILGFAMVNTYVQKCSFGHSIAEFMVLPKFRRNKIGKKAAAMCFEKYPGNWEVSPSFGSGQAYLFWKNVIDEYTDKKNTYEDGIFCF